MNDERRMGAGDPSTFLVQGASPSTSEGNFYRTTGSSLHPLQCIQGATRQPSPEQSHEFFFLIFCPNLTITDSFPQNSLIFVNRIHVNEIILKTSQETITKHKTLTSKTHQTPLIRNEKQNHKKLLKNSKHSTLGVT